MGNLRPPTKLNSTSTLHVFLTLLLLFLSLASPSHAEAVHHPRPAPNHPTTVDTPAQASSPLPTSDTSSAHVKSASPPRVTLNLQDVDLRELVRILGQQAGVTTYADPAVKGTASINVENLPIDQALSAILRPRGYVIQKFPGEGDDGESRYFVYDPSTTRRLFVEICDGRLTVDIQRFQLSDVLAEIARESKRSIVPFGDASASLTLALQDVPLEDGLEEIAYSGGCKLFIVGRGDTAVYRVVSMTGNDTSIAPAAIAVATALAPPPPFELTKLDTGRIRVRAASAPLKDLIAAIAEVGDLSVLIGPEVSGTTTSYLASAAPRDAIQSIASQAGLRVFTQNDVMIVATAQANQLTVQMTDNAVNVLAYDAPVREALTRIALAGNLPALAFDPSVDGTVSLTLSNKKPREALEKIAEARSLRIEERGGSLRITDPAREKRMRIMVQGGLVSMDVQNTPFQEVVKEFGTRTGLNITSPRADTLVSITIQSLPTPASLRAIADAAGLAVAEDADRFRLVAKSAQATGIAKARVTDGLLSLECEDAEISLVVKSLADESGKNFLIETGVAGVLTGKVENLPFEEGLRTFLATKGFRLRNANGVYRIASGTAPQPGAEAAPNFELAYESGLLTLNVTDADLGALLRQIADEAGLDFNLYGTAHEKVNTIIRHVPLDTALARIFAGTKFGYLYSLVDSTLSVGDISQPGPMAAMATCDVVIPLKNMPAKDLPALLPPEIPAAQVKIMASQNAILLTGRQEMIQRARTFIAKVDHPPTQVHIEGLLVEYRTTRGYAYNLSTLNITGKPPDIANLAPSQGALSITTTDLKNFNNPQFQGALTALVERGEASIRARPSITTVAGYDASGNVEDQENFRVVQPSASQGVPLVQIQGINSGIKIEATPYVSADASDAVTIEFFFQDSSPGDRTSDGLPAISTRNAKTRVVVKSGHTTVIGGLIRSDDSRNKGGFPILSSIPVVGSLFGRVNTSDRQTELVFYMTPTIVTSDTTVAQSFEAHGAKVEPEALGLPSAPANVPPAQIVPAPAAAPAATPSAPTAYPNAI